MANAYKVLCQGQLGNSVATLATVGGGKSWLVRDISMVNTDSSDRTVGLYHNGVTGTTAITPTAVNIVAGGAYTFSGGVLAFAAADTLSGGASVASKVTITVTGDEIS